MQGRVIKFGGTSLGDAARIAAAADAVAAARATGPVAVVVSAVAGVTDRLAAIAACAMRDGAAARADLVRLLDDQRAVAAALRFAPDAVRWPVDGIAPRLHAALEQVAAGSERARDVLLAAGEKLAAWLLLSVLHRDGVVAAMAPAEHLIRTDSAHGNAGVDQTATRAAIGGLGHAYWADTVRVVPGFTGADRHGHTTTLGRNASDYSAALLAAALVWPLEIWTDVAGCYDADPRQVPGARLLRCLAVADAHRFARAGASVIHARTLEPLLGTPVAVRIVNSFAPDADSTGIGRHGEPLRGVALRADLILLHGAAAQSVADPFDRGGNLLDSSPVAAVVGTDLPPADAIAVVSLFDDAATGDLWPRCRTVLTQAGIEPLAAWRSPADRALRFAVRKADGCGCLRALHREVLSQRQATPVYLALLGASGRVGQGLLRIIGQRAPGLARRGIALELIALANSRRACFSDRAIEPASATALLAAADDVDADRFSHDLLARAERPLVLVDCTASADVAARYPRWLEAGIDIVTPNKHAPAGDAGLLAAIGAAEQASGARLFHETTVGAQLPLLRTLRELVAAGDHVERLEAVLSGTLSYVLGRVRQGVAFSAAVAEAVRSGYAEPNPAGDLSGADAARKLAIVLRALGIAIETRDIEVTPLVPDTLLAEPDGERLLAGLAALDESWRDAAALAAAAGECWVYRASHENGRARIGAERVSLDHPFAGLQPCENALRLSSTYYRAAPLNVSGPGAGIELTAAGVHADLMAAIERRVPLSCAGAKADCARQPLRGAA
jgi:aspartokinase/homoserine dehydrogenase 1